MSKRRQFLKELKRFILPPYETTEKYEEEIIGEFENEIEEEFFREFLKYTGRDKVILELACGDGRHTLRLARNFRKVIAVDLSLNQLKMAKRKCKNMRNIAFINASMLELDFPAQSFDGIWFSQAFEYIPPDKREKFLKYLFAILKKNGVLYMSVETWMYPNIFQSIKELIENLKLYLYWKLIKHKPLLWGEFFYSLSPKIADIKYTGWHYHVHTDKWTLCKLLHKNRFKILKFRLRDGYIYTICKKRMKR